MAKVQIILEDGETQRDAEEGLHKALNYHASGDVHDSESFDDPAMIDVSHRMEQEHKKIYQEMLNEIFLELDKDYTK